MDINEFFLQNRFLIIVLLVWSLYWKGQALWKAANRKDKNWFIVLLVVSTVGILDILYLYVFTKKKSGKK